MIKQFDLQALRENTLVEKVSQLPLRYKKIYNIAKEVDEEALITQEISSLEKIVVGLPMGKATEDWTLLTVATVHVFTNIRPFEKKYPVMLEYPSDNKHVVYMTQIDDKWHVLVIRNDEVLLVPTSEEMVPQDAVFISSEKKLVPLHSDNKFLYWTVDNEFKLLEKDSQDTQVLSAEFLVGNLLGDVIEQTPAIELNDNLFKLKPKSDNNSCRPYCDSQIFKPKPQQIKKKQNSADEAAAVFFFISILALVFFCSVLSFDTTTTIVGAIFILFFILIVLLD